jgi:hypothetical protein
MQIRMPHQSHHAPLSSRYHHYAKPIDDRLSFVFVLNVPSAEGRYFARRRESGAGRGTCVRGSQPRTRAAAGQPPRGTMAPRGSGRRKRESGRMPRWRALRRGRSRIERQGPDRRARPSNRAGLE